MIVGAAGAGADAGAESEVLINQTLSWVLEMRMEGWLPNLV